MRPIIRSTSTVDVQWAWLFGRVLLPPFGGGVAGYYRYGTALTLQWPDSSALRALCRYHYAHGVPAQSLCWAVDGHLSANQDDGIFRT